MITEKIHPVPLSEVPIGAFQALFAALILAAGSSLGGDVLFLLGLPLTLAGFFLACCAARNWAKPEAVATLPWTTAGLASMAALGIIGPTTGGQLWYEVMKRAFAAAAIVLVGIISSERTIWQRRTVIVTLSAGAVLFAIAPVGAPHPAIDVFAWTQTSVRALLHGTHPYTVIAPDVYRGRHDPGYTVAVYPYMPATLIVFAPWVVALGDFRFALAASLILTIILIQRIGRRLGVSPSFTWAAALAIVLHPSSSRMIESGWTESLLVATAALFVYFALRNPQGVGQVATFFLLPALKQYILAPAVLYLIRARHRVPIRAVVAGLLISAATIAPFLIWNWRATLSGVVFQMSSPTIPRLESTSLVALLATLLGVYPGRWTSVVVQLVVAALAWWRLAGFGLSGLLLASALSLYATFLFGWQAFVNYYYFVGALLILAALIRAAPRWPRQGFSDTALGTRAITSARGMNVG